MRINVHFNMDIFYDLECKGFQIVGRINVTKSHVSSLQYLIANIVVNNKMFHEYDINSNRP